MVDQAARRRRRWRVARNVSLRTFGVLGILHQTLVVSPENRSDALILFFGGLVMGVPFLRADDTERDRRDDDGEGRR